MSFSISKTLKLSSLLLLFALKFQPLSAGVNGDSLIYTDFLPSYTQWQTNYILDKIEYWTNKTIFHFRYVAEFQGGMVTYYGPSGESPWYLKNLDPKPGVPNDISLTEVRNIKVNGQVRCKVLRNQPLFQVEQISGEVHTVEIIFPRLNVGMGLVNLIEGRGHETSELHFNCFKVTVKPPGSPDLGSEKDMKQKIRQFETRHGIDGPPAEPEPEPEKPVVVEAPPPLPKEKVQSEAVISVYFPYDQTKFQCPALADQYLNYVANFLRKNPDWSIKITGFSDANVSPDVGAALSKARADAVAAYLADLGVPSGKMQIEALGIEKPKVAPGNGRNRRVEITFFR